MKNLISAFKNEFSLLKSGINCSSDTRGELERPRYERARSPIRMSLIFAIVLSSVLAANAKNQKALKGDVHESKTYHTPQLAGSSPLVKPANGVIHALVAERRLSVASESNDKRKTGSNSVSWQQLVAKVNAQSSISDVTIYTGVFDQHSPQVVVNGTELYTAFEDYDTSGGNPYGRIDVYRSTNGGGSWTYWDYVSSQVYHLYSPQILIVKGNIILAYQRNGALRTFRFDPAATYPNPDVPLPAISPNEYVVDQRMVSDVEQFPGTPWIYMASLFRQTDGKLKVLFNISKDTARTWWPYDSLGLSEGELNASSIGLDYGKSGLYVAYLGTDLDAGEILLRKSIDLGSTWESEIYLPNDIYGGLNRKVGPMVSAIGDRVAIVYQYDYYNNGSDWRTAQDFDIYAVVSSDAGASWLQRSVGSTNFSEILPCVSHDADSNFYVSYLREGKVRVSMAGNEFAFGIPDSSTSINPVSLDYFPAIAASNLSGGKNAYTVWTASSIGDDIYGATVGLQIPPLSPTNLTYSVISSSEIDLSWQDNSSDELGFRIYGAGPADTVYKLIGSVGQNVRTFQATGLSPVTTYEFYVRAFNVSGNSLRTTIESATTNPSAGSPLAPSGLAANAVSSSEIDLSWFDNSSNESGFRIERSPDDISYVNIASLGPNITSYQDYSVVPGTTYYYRVSAYNSNGNSGNSNVSSATTFTSGNTPSAPYGLTADVISASEINLNWTDNSTNEDGFTIERSTDNFATSNNLTSVGPNITNYHDHSVNSGTTYYYRVFAYSNANGSSGYSNIASATTPGGGPNVTQNSPDGQVTVDNGIASQGVSITATATDVLGIQRMYLEYQQIGQAATSTLDFTSPYSFVTVQIPASTFVYNGQAIGVTYRIVAINNNQQKNSTPWHSVDVWNGASIAIHPSITFPAASNLPNNFSQAYRIFSIPFDLNDKQPSTLFSSPNNFGDHAQNGTPYVNWRLERINGGNYQDYENFKNDMQALAPGKAFFLLLRDQKNLTLGGNRVSNADTMYNSGIQLSGGMNSNSGGAWYLLGDPLNMVIPWSSLEFSPTSVTVLDHAYYSGTGPVSGWEMSASSDASTLRPWEGLAVKTSGPCTVRFKVLPQLARIHGPQGSDAGTAAALQKTESSPDDWLITVAAYRPDIDMRCEGGGIGMHVGAEADHDQYDSYLPPIVGEKNVAVGFTGPNGPRLRDIRPLNANGGVWSMQVMTVDAGARVKLQFGDVVKIPNPSFDAYLIDLDEKAAYNLKEMSTLEISSGQGVRNFNVVIGTQTYVQQNNAGVELQPSSAKLCGNYPNPFNPETIVRYTIPNSQQVSQVVLKVYNMLGQEVATLVDGPQTSGYYEAKFNGQNRSSGVYFCTLTVSNGSKTYKETKKMMLLR